MSDPRQPTSTPIWVTQKARIKASQTLSGVTPIDSGALWKGIRRKGLTIQLQGSIDSGFHTGRLGRRASSLTTTQDAASSCFIKPLSFKRHRFPREVILHSVWL